MTVKKYISEFIEGYDVIVGVFFGWIIVGIGCYLDLLFKW